MSGAGAAERFPVLLSANNYHYYRGGAETVFLEHNRMFEALGWRVVPFAMKHARNLESAWQEYFVDEIEFGEDYTLLQKLARIPKVIYSFEARRKLGRLLNVVRPDVFHGHNLYHHISPSILGLLRQRSVPTVLTLHDLKIACPAYNMLARDGICERCRGGRYQNVVLHRCIKGSLALSSAVMVESILHAMLGSYTHAVDRFIVPSRFYIEKFHEWGYPREKFVHVPNFVDAVRYEAAFEAGGHFLYFGRLSPEKGIATLIRAAAQAGVSLSIAGTGPQAAELQSLAKNLGGSVVFLGYLAGSHLHDAVRSARAVVLPSEWYENAPMSLLEAYALGKPVIGASIGGIPELIIDGRTGMTFQSRSVEALAKALVAMTAMADTDVSAMGREGRAWVESAFSARQYMASMLEVYGSLGALTTPMQPQPGVS